MIVKLETRKIAIVASAALVLFLAWTVYSKYSKSSSREAWCSSRCQEYRSRVIDGTCHCSTDYGWIKAGIVEKTVAKIKMKCEHKRKR